VAWIAIRGELHPEALTSKNNLGVLLTLRGAYAEAEMLLRGVVDQRRATLGEEDETTIVSMLNLLRVYEESGRPDETERWLTHLLPLCRRFLGEGHPNTLLVMSSWAYVLNRQGRVQESVAVSEEIVRLEEALYGEVHANPLASRLSLADGLILLGRHDEAAAHLEEVMRRAATLGANHRLVYDARLNRAILHRARGRLDEAFDEAVEVVELMQASHTVMPTRVLEAQLVLGLVLRELGRWEEADVFYREVLGTDPPEVTDAKIAELYLGFGLCQRQAGRFEEAQAAFLKVQSFYEVHGSKDLGGRTVMQELVSLYEAWGRPKEAESWRARLAPAIE
jgi:tetratricopeptide (TPR) repeat protein